MAACVSLKNSAYADTGLKQGETELHVSFPDERFAVPVECTITGYTEGVLELYVDIHAFVIGATIYFRIESVNSCYFYFLKPLYMCLEHNKASVKKQSPFFFKLYTSVN